MSFKRAFQLFFIALPIFCIDYTVKALTSFFIQPIEYAPPVFPFGGISVFHNFFGVDFCLNHVANRGAAWGIFGSIQEVLLMFRMAVIASLLGYLIFSPKSKSQQLPLTLVITGALGNIVDYFAYGHVIDMFHFIFWEYSYPVFNVADATIFCGVALMIIQSVIEKRYASQTQPS